MKIYRKLISLVIIFLFISPVVYANDFPKYTNLSNVFTLPKYEIIHTPDNITIIQIDGWYQIQNINGYKLPRNIYKVKLPLNKKYVGFTTSNIQIDKSNNQINIMHRSVINTGIKQLNNTVFDLNKKYKLCTFLFLQKTDIDIYAVFDINPCIYDEKLEILTIFKSFQINIILKDTLNVIGSAEVKVEDKYDYCIIARYRQIPLFLEYKNFMEERGIKTILYPLEYVYQLNNQLKEERVRQVLNDLYIKNGIENVLLVGSDYTIPMIRLMPFGRDTQDDQIIPSDFYYAELSSDWDSNENGYYGEYERDQIDFTPEIGIGRLPFDFDFQIKDYLNHVMSFYEENKDNRRKILVAGAWLSFKEERNSVEDKFDCDGGRVVYTDYKNYFNDFAYKGLFEKDGLRLSKVVNFGDRLSYSNFINTMNEFDPMVVLLSGHGNWNTIERKIWEEDTNNNKITDQNEITHESFIDTKSFSLINNNKHCIVFADSCSTCEPGYIDLGSEFLESNAVGYLGSTASSVYFLIHDSDPLNYEVNTSSFGLTAHIEKHFSNKNKIGKAIQKGIEDYWLLCENSNARKYLTHQIQNIYEVCFYGDPILGLDTFVKIKDLDYQSQDLVNEGNLSYNIREISIAEDQFFYSIKCKIYEPIIFQNYLVTLRIDSDLDSNTGNIKNYGEDYFFVLGFNEKKEFLSGYLKWNQYKNDWDDSTEGLIYNRYSFVFYISSVWIKFPKSFIKGNSFRYRISFINQDTSEYSNYPSTTIKDRNYFALYPKNGNTFPPSKPLIKNINIINKTILLSLEPSIQRNFPIKGYEIYKRINQGDYRRFAILGNNEVAFTDTEYIQDSIFYYKIKAFDNQDPPNFSEFSDEVYISIPKDISDTPQNPKDIIPPKPVILNGIYDDTSNSVLITWSFPTSGTYPIKGFEVYKGESNISILFLRYVDKSILTLKDADIKIGKTYTYYVLTIDDQNPPNKSVSSNFITVKTTISNNNNQTLIELKVGSQYAIVNNQFVILDLAPFSKNNRVFVPLRFIAEAFGAKIEWKEDNNKNGEGLITITYIKKDSSVLKIQMHTLDKNAIISTERNGQIITRKELALDAPAFIVKPANRTVVPIRFISETFGAVVDWNESTETIKIKLEK
jgi:hypothetical protein